MTKHPADKPHADAQDSQESSRRGFPGRQSGDLSVTVGTQSLWLLPERAVFAPEQQTLFVADTHWGKEATFRAARIPIPEGGLQSDLDRLTRLLRRTAANRLIVLGDLLHAKQGRDATTFATVRRWRSSFPALQIDLVRGNHDRSAGDPPGDWLISCHPEPLTFGELTLRHHPPTDDAPNTLCGHLHPCARLRGRGRQSLKLPCFLFQQNSLVLPAFSSFVDGTVYPLEKNDHFAVIADEEVFPFPGSSNNRNKHSF